MTAVVRHTNITNTTGGLLTSVVIDVGQEYGFFSIKRTFISAEVTGTGAGTVKASTGPGLLFAQFKGGIVKGIYAPSLIKSVTINTNYTFDSYVLGSITSDNMSRLNFYVDNSIAGLSSVYLIDTGTGTDSTIIKTGDKVQVLMEVGNT
jgi:hypothetical protein